MIDASTGLIIERDYGEGTADRACPEGKPAADCFNIPASRPSSSASTRSK